MIEEKHLQHDNIEVFYLHKPALNPVVSLVFIHGFPFSSEMWKDQLLALPANIEAFAYDIRGFGKSTSSHSFFSVDLFARDLLDFLSHLKIEKAVLCGISMGGYIALRAAEIHLDEIAGLVLCDTNCITDTNEAKLKRFASIDLIQKGKKVEFAEGFLKSVFYEKSFDSKPEAIDLIKRTIIKTSDDTICGTQLALASRTETNAVLESINVPALIVRGAEDKIMTADQATQLATGIKGAELITVPNAGHLPNLENPIDFNTHLNTFLKKHF